MFPGLHACFLLYIPLWLGLIKFWLCAHKSQWGHLPSAFQKQIPFGYLIRTAVLCRSQIIPRSPPLRYALSMIPPLLNVGDHWTQLQILCILLPTTSLHAMAWSRPAPSLVLEYSESYVCGLPKYSLPPSKLSMTARQGSKRHSDHVIICLCVQWFPLMPGVLFLYSAWLSLIYPSSSSIRIGPEEYFQKPSPVGKILLLNMPTASCIS